MIQFGPVDWAVGGGAIDFGCGPSVRIFKMTKERQRRLRQYDTHPRTIVCDGIDSTADQEKIRIDKQDWISINEIINCH